jgi:hypothetical protein
MAWQRAKVENVKLSSGNEAILREVDPAALIMANADTDSIPEWLTAQVIEEFTNPKKRKGTLKVPLDRKSLPVYGKFIELVVKAAMVSPRIVDDPNYDNDEIGMVDVKMRDRMEIFARVMPGEEFAAAEKFPEQHNGSVEPARTGEGLPEVAQ